ncbi:proto-oncogene tyrosine protein kinase FER, putative [Entamoeba invadens IP1]|uniref:Proto-oncogene tyrosine protein kinase FER, putative n=1 Tax=Entamoeba invadens IP1 TaxID=370355 RepID=A0A0A1TW81_ENTIV|nr:proto-oncogene tyrosine protein kinase FER, putative [Entamoeba invadens IP1]ELP84746.1 proto-oncogene tyrosine protein kinase FER, putative [Entamoeba invadens IP1]|eukprot:XP_004184092.1 proto-oncogene tyrosine protein kinase FER, putative [Entamoeba invadens IP1]
MSNSTSSNTTFDNSTNSPPLICPPGYFYVKGECVQSTHWILGVSITCSLLLALVMVLIIVVWFLSRKKTTSSRDRYSRVHSDDFPLHLSKTELTFESEGITMSINTQYTDEINITNTSDIEKSFKIEFDATQYILKTEPECGVLGPHSSVDVQFTITLKCSCKQYPPINVVSFDGTSEVDAIDEDIVTTPVQVCASCEDTLLLDFKEISTKELIANGLHGDVVVSTYRGQTVVVKKFKLSWTEEARSFFVERLGEVTQMRHSNLITIFGCVVTPNHEALVMEFAEHGNARTCYRRGEMELKLREKVLIDVCKGIQYLHSNNRVHGCIKPTNMLMVSINPQSTVCCKLGHYWDLAEMTSLIIPKIEADNEIMMQNSYFTAPECFKESSLTAEADVYSLGMSILEIYQQKMVYPERPFSNGWDAATEIVKGKRPDVPNSVDEKIKNLVTKCWEQKLESRPKIGEILKTFMELQDQS